MIQDSIVNVSIERSMMIILPVGSVILELMLIWFDSSSRCLMEVSYIYVPDSNHILIELAFNLIEEAKDSEIVEKLFLSHEGVLSPVVVDLVES